mgnify:CR=1 FL=1
MKKITETELQAILAQHKLWVDSDGDHGKGADLRGADLRCADLQDANLEKANLKYACLYGTILEEKKENVSEKSETVSASSNLRAELEAVAKKHGMKIDDLKLSIL